MNKEFFEAIEMFETERGIPQEYMLDKVEAALLSAAKKAFGTADNAVDCSNSKKAVEIYKNARLELIEGAGHGFLKENGVRAMELLKDFVN